MAARTSTLNEGRLPKWAQERLNDYRREITNLREKMAAAAEGTQEGPFFFEFYDRDKELPFYVPRYARLQHCNPAGDRRGVLEFQDDGGDGWVKIYAHDGTIHVQPSAANVIKIKVERHR